MTHSIRVFYYMMKYIALYPYTSVFTPVTVKNIFN